MTAKIHHLGPEAAAMVARLEAARDSAGFVTEDQIRAKREAWDQAQWGDRLRSSGIFDELDDDAKRAVLANRARPELPTERVKEWWSVRRPLDPDQAPSGPPWLFLCGGKGCGKSTAAAHVLAREWGLYTIMSTLMADYTTWKRAKPHERHSSMFERYKRSGVLVLDELGMEKDSEAEAAREAFFALVNGRQSKRTHTIVISNLSRDLVIKRVKTGVYDERSHDRLRSISLVLGFEGQSLRKSLPGGGL